MNETIAMEAVVTTMNSKTPEGADFDPAEVADKVRQALDEIDPEILVIADAAFGVGWVKQELKAIRRLRRAHITRRSTIKRKMDKDLEDAIRKRAESSAHTVITGGTGDVAATGDGRPLARRGLADAFLRFEERWDMQDDEGALAALVEALMWIDNLDGLERDLNDSYAERRQSSQPLDGLQWARDRGVHVAAELQHLQEGAAWPLRFPIRFRTYCWRGRLDVGEPRAKHRSGRRYREKSVAYDTLAGKPVDQTLIEAMNIVLGSEPTRQLLRQASRATERRQQARFAEPYE